MKNKILSLIKKRPSQSDFTTTYYYLGGKLVGKGEMINRECHYSSSVDGFESYAFENKIIYAVMEKCVDMEAFNAAREAYESQYLEYLEDFYKLMEDNFGVTPGVIDYFYSATNGNLRAAASEIEDFIQYKDGKKGMDTFEAKINTVES